MSSVGWISSELQLLQYLSANKSAIMSDSGEVEVETVSGYQVLPKEVTEEIGSIKLFNKWYVGSRTWKDRRIEDNTNVRKGLMKMSRFAISL